MIFGESDDALPAMPSNELMFNDTLQHMFSNPLFMRHIPNSPGMTTERLSPLDERTIPPKLKPMSQTASRAEVTSNELLLNSDLDWLNHVKYIVSTLCHITDQLTHFRLVNDPYDLTELTEAVANLNEIAHLGPDTEYVDARSWMTIFHEDVEFTLQQLRIEDTVNQDTDE